ncbi:MAG: VTT domain-containing protein, partial [Oscillospiraceae bacterium]|nr:VTT domain-containing protein [Oscillospiraceae bacterium]
MEKKSSGSRRKAPEIILTVVILCIIAVLFCFFLKDILIPFLRLEFRNDVDGAQALLKDRGLLGFLTVTLVEGLQMVVIFIPAEFIQISSGLSYPFPIALLLCDLGVCLGASIIYFLVHTFRSRFSVLEKRNSALDRLSSGMHARSVVLILYLLFFMPIVPFGAICYYGSSKRISYGRYLFTVATGVIPSIVVSNLMGTASRAFIERDLPFWLLVVIIVLLAAALFCLIFLFLDRVGFRDSDRTPDSLVYALLFFVVRIWCRGRGRHLTIEDELLRAQTEPYLLLCNHGSFYDFYYISEMGHPRNPAYLVNEYYTSRPILRTLAKKAGILSKKLFTPGIGAASGILRSLRAGFPVVIFPEGRLSLDGRSNPIVEPGG